jgi:hypothetical protein
MSVGYFQKYSFYGHKYLLYSKNFFQLYYFVIKPTNLFDTTTYPLFLPLERIAAAFRFVLLATKARRPTLLFSLLNILLRHSISFFLLSKVRRPTLFFSLLKAFLSHSISFFLLSKVRDNDDLPSFLPLERITAAFYFVLFAVKSTTTYPLFLPLKRNAAAFRFVLLATKLRALPSISLF